MTVTELVAIQPRALRRAERLAKRAQSWMNLGPLKSVRRLPLGIEGHCYTNVQRQCQRAGGTVALGWWLCQEPGRFLAAFHHAIWRAPTGELFDLETPDPSDKSKFATFLPDPTPLELASPEPIDDRDTLLASPRQPRFLALSEDAYTIAMLDAFALQVEAEKGQIRVEVHRECRDAILGEGAWLRAILDPCASTNHCAALVVGLGA